MKYAIVVYLLVFVSCNTSPTLPNSAIGAQAIIVDHVYFSIGCANALAVDKQATCSTDAAGCQTVSEYFNNPATQTFISQCGDKVIAIWLDIDGPGSVSQANIDKWVTLTLATLEYLKTSKLSGNSITASINNAQAALDRINNNLYDYNASVDTKKNDITNNTIARIQSLLSTKIGDEKKELVENKQTIQKINVLLSNYQKSADDKVNLYVNVIKQYMTQIKSDPKDSADLLQIAKDASSVDNYDQLNKLKLNAINISGKALASLTGTCLDATQLRNNLWSIQDRYHWMLYQHGAFLQKLNLKIPDILTENVNSLLKMETYCDSRKTFLTESTKNIINGIQSREKALILSKTNITTQKANVQSAYLKLSHDYMNQMNTKINDLWASPQKSKFFNLAYLKEKYDRMNGMLQQEIMCNKASNSWMSTGCALLRVEFTKVHNYLKDGLPLEIQMHVEVMRSAGVGSDILSKILQSPVNQAVVYHDIALLDLESHHE